MAPSHTYGHSEGSPSHNSDDESDYHEHELRNSTATTRGKAAAANSKKKPSASRRASNSATAANDDALHLMHEDSADPQNARKMQNRLAQREFRARRLEHIKELEARVEFLSKPQSEQTEILVAIIHGLMDENKQLRGSLKTMANFVSTGLGGFSNAIQLPKYDNALELVNRGDRALLLKLVQEKGASIGSSHASGSGNVDTQASASPLPTVSSTTTSSTATSTSAHDDRKRKIDSVSHDASSNDRTAHHPSAAKAPRTRSQNQRTRQEHQKSNDKQQETSASRKSPQAVAGASSSSASVSGQNAEQMYPNGTEAQGQYPDRPHSSISGLQIGASPLRDDATRATDIFPSYLGAGNSLNTFDIFSGSGGNNTSSNSGGTSGAITPSFGANFVKQEESPPLPAYGGDPASAWMNAYTNLTPMGGNESFWSLTSSAMNNQQANSYSASSTAQQSQQQQQQQQQQQLLSRLQAPSPSDPQDGRSPSSAYLSTWGNTAAQMLSSNGTLSNAFSSVPLQGMQPPLHGYA